MVLFESESQYREKATIWRIFSLLPLYAPLADGHIWRWFAVNIPMDLGTGGEFTSDIDVLARLRNNPPDDGWFYRAWEVKVSLIHEDGTCRSLKAGRKKVGKVKNQLSTYRKFGCPHVSLLDAYICETGYLRKYEFPPDRLVRAVREKLGELHAERFGYQLLPFEHDKDGDSDVGLLALHVPQEPFQGPAVQTSLPLLQAVTHEPHNPFSKLAARLDNFFEKSRGRPFQQIIFCRNCRSLQLICMREGDYLCPMCHSDLIIQS
jgi:hypothetical protein